MQSIEKHNIARATVDYKMSGAPSMAVEKKQPLSLYLGPGRLS
jgi:hypothetical protein